jgi:DNA-binding CsgD family transcriptional regulator
MHSPPAGVASQGRSNEAIVRALGTTPEAIKSHVGNIYGQLGVQSRAQAAAMMTPA